jgi:outer membrane receptor protein involved in Fe transport
VTDRISLKKAMLLGSVGTGLFVSAMALSATAAMAQDAAKPEDAAADTIVVTGTRIQRPDLQATAPVTVVGAEDIKATGATKIEDLLNNLPSVFANQNSGVSNGSDGTARVDLRNLGSNRTLVIIDGRRLAPGSFGGSGAADLNFIPSALITNIQVLTGGASSTYGADAVSGVVNFVMNRKFEGVRFDAGYSFYQHTNNNDIQNIVNLRFAPPKGNVTHGGSFDSTVVIGASMDEGKGHVTAYAGYRRDSAITQDAYDYSLCTLNASAVTPTNSFGLACGGSGTPEKTRFGGFSTANRTAAGLPSASTYSLDPAVGAGRGLRPFVTSDQFNFAPANYYRRPSTRYTLGAFAEYEINEHFTPYIEAMFMDYSTKAQIAPSGAFFSFRSVNCDNPLLLASPVIATAACGTAGVGTSDSVDILIGKRNVEGGPRFNDLAFNQFRSIVGVKGEISDAWTYDVYAQYGQVTGGNVYRNDVSETRISRALQVVNVNGTPTCKSVVDGTDPACVPYNIFQIGGVTQAAANYIGIPLVLTGKTKQFVTSGFLSGDLGKYGFQSPLAEAGVSMVLGAEYRREKLDTQPDLAYINGDGAGQGGPTLPLSGRYAVKELFTEVNIPLAQDQAFAQDLSITGGFRYSDYSNASGGGFNASTWKIEGAWAPIEEVKLRASLNRAVRAPNIGELFSNSSVGLAAIVDPCAGDFDPTSADPAPTATLAQCQATGVSAAQYGNVLYNFAEQYNTFSGGNVNLDPEKATTWTLGAVIQPRSLLPNFSLTVDYFNIKVKEAIGVIGASVIINQCISTADPFFCSRIRRGPGASLWLDESGFVFDLVTNTGSIKTSGVDVSANYKFDINDSSSLSLALNGTYLDSLRVQPLTNGFTFDCAGYYGTTCGTANAKWRHNFSVKYQTPWPLSVQLKWRHIDGVKVDTLSPDDDLNGGSGPNSPTPNDDTLPTTDYFDLVFGLPVTDKVNLRLGVNNIFDKDPPIISQSSLTGTIGNGNTIVGTYDYLGRYIFMNATVDF